MLSDGCNRMHSSGEFRTANAGFARQRPVANRSCPTRTGWDKRDLGVFTVSAPRCHHATARRPVAAKACI